MSRKMCFGIQHGCLVSYMYISPCSLDVLLHNPQVLQCEAVKTEDSIMAVTITAQWSILIRPRCVNLDKTMHRDESLGILGWQSSTSVNGV